VGIENSSYKKQWGRQGIIGSKKLKGRKKIQGKISSGASKKKKSQQLWWRGEGRG